MQRLFIPPHAKRSDGPSTVQPAKPATVSSAPPGASLPPPRLAQPIVPPTTTVFRSVAPPPPVFSPRAAVQAPPPQVSAAPVVQRVATIAGKVIKREQFIAATKGYRASDRRALSKQIGTSVKDFANVAEFADWTRIFTGYTKRRRALSRGKARRKTGYVAKSGKPLLSKHSFANLGINKSEAIRALLVNKRKASTNSKKKQKIAPETVAGMFGDVKLYDQGNYDATPFTTAKLSDFGHDPKVDKRAANPPRSKKAPTAYAQLIHDVKHSPAGDSKMAAAMLSYLDNEAWKIDENLTSYVKKSVSVFLTATQASEEGRNPGSAKYARTLLKAIAKGKTTFAAAFGDPASALYTPAQTEGSGAFAMELDEFDETNKGHEMALSYQSDSSGDEGSDDYDPEKDAFWD